MGLAADRREWDDLARRDAMWAVCSNDGRLGNWTPEEFLASGEAEVGGILAGLEGAGLAPQTGRALDFGCGLGRLTRALAARFDEVVGVDISAEMVARATALHANRPNLRFVANARADLEVLGEQRFDLVLSLIALQHVSSADAVRAYLGELARVAAPGGILVLQLPARVGRRVSGHPLRALNAAVRRLPSVPDPVLQRLVPYSMSLTALPEPEVRDLLADAGAPVVTAFGDRRTGSTSVPSLVYVARRG